VVFSPSVYRVTVTPQRLWMLLRGRLLLRLRLWLRFRSHLVTSARCGVNELSQTALMAHSNAAWQQTPPRLDAFACCTRALATAVGEKKTKSRPKHWVFAVGGRKNWSHCLALHFALVFSASALLMLNGFVFVSSRSRRCRWMWMSVWASVCPARCLGGMVMANPNL